MSGLIGTLEGDVQVSASAQRIYEVLCTDPQQLLSIVPDVIKSCDLLEGVWGLLGAITQWTYVLGGETKFIKLIISAANPFKTSVTYGLIEGDLKTEFSSFAVTYAATPLIGGGCNVHMTMAYVKLSLDVSPPQDLFDLGLHVIKALGESLVAQA